MDEYKFISVWDLLNFLKLKVKTNVDLIKINNEKIKELNGNPDMLKTNFLRIKQLTNQNVNITQENNFFLNIFNDLIKLRNNFAISFNSELAMVGQPPVDKFKTEEERHKEYFEKTINGEIPIDDNHPLRHDHEFLQSVFAHCLENEQYEKCAAVKNLINRDTSMDI